MEKKEYLNEENFQQVNNKIKSKGKLITNIILGIGILLILSGVILLITNKKDNNNDRDLIENKIIEKEKELEDEKENLEIKLSNIKSELNNKKQNLISKGIKESSNYNNGEAYDLYILDNVLDPSFSYCKFDEYQNNKLTKDYCTLFNVINENAHSYSCKNNDIIKKYCSLEIELSNLRYNKKFPTTNLIESITHIPLIIIGVFITIASLMAKFMLFSITHRRELLAYTTQQVMPVAQEGIEKMAPTIGKAGSKITKEMAPAYGDMAKEITKGIKEGLKDEEK